MENLNPNEYTYNLNYSQKKDPEQDYSGFAYALNNFLTGGGINNLFGSGGLPGGGTNNLFGSGVNESFTSDIYGGQQPLGLASLFQNGAPFLADLLYGNKFRTNDTQSMNYPNVSFMMPQNNQNNLGYKNITE